MDRLKWVKNIFKGDRTIWILFFFLCFISIVEVYSSSASLGFKSGNYTSAVISQCFMLFLGFLCMIVIQLIPCRYFKACTFLYLGVLVLLVVVLFCGTTENDASRWLKVGGFSLQPSELAKGMMVLTTATILSLLQTPDGAAPKAFWSVLLASSMLILFVFPENFSTAALMFCVMFIMMWIGRVGWKYLVGLLTVVVTALALFFGAIMFLGQTETQIEEEQKAKGVEYSVSANGENAKEVKERRGGILHRADAWKGRIVNFLDKKEVPPEEYDMDTNGQVGRANIAIVSGGIFGVGLGRSRQRDLLPLAFSDFIFAIIFEEGGAVGATLVAFLYFMLLFRTGTIARNCENTFPALLAMGLALMIVIQALFNICVAVGLAPVTGQPLPLVSKGGTSAVINCIYLGVILSVSRTAKKRSNVVH